MRKFIAWLFGVKPEHVRKTFYHCYGEGAHYRLCGDAKSSNPYQYGTLEHDAWDDGWEGRK